MAEIGVIELILLAFGLVLSSMGSVAVWILNEGRKELKLMQTSVAELNRKIAVVVTRVDSHENRITRLEG